MSRLLAALVLLPCTAFAALAQDATACSGGTITNCPSATGTTGASIAPAAFSTGQAVELVIAVASVAGTGIGSTTISANGGAYSTAWTRIGACANGTTANAEIWGAITSAALSNVTVTASFTITTARASVITVVPFSVYGNASLPTNYVCASGAGSAQTVSVTLGYAGDLVLGGGADSAVATARTYTANMLALDVKAGATSYAWVERGGGNLLPAGAATVGTTAPVASTVWAFLAVDLTNVGEPVCVDSDVGLPPDMSTFVTSTWVSPPDPVAASAARSGSFGKSIR